uniref:NADH-ubiquinone oxidoreductase 9 kDa subunit n=1 Tax=Ascaris lumbricoides TaxID=6252 RepID=A0A0M3ICY0_ASCLU
MTKNASICSFTRISVVIGGKYAFLDGGQEKQPSPRVGATPGGSVAFGERPPCTSEVYKYHKENNYGQFMPFLTSELMVSPGLQPQGKAQA